MRRERRRYMHTMHKPRRSERSEKRYFDGCSSLARAAFGASGVFLCADTKCLRAASHALTRVSARSAGFSCARNPSNASMPLSRTLSRTGECVMSMVAVFTKQSGSFTSHMYALSSCLRKAAARPTLVERIAQLAEAASAIVLPYSWRDAVTRKMCALLLYGGRSPVHG